MSHTYCEERDAAYAHILAAVEPVLSKQFAVTEVTMIHRPDNKDWENTLSIKLQTAENDDFPLGAEIDLALASVYTDTSARWRIRNGEVDIEENLAGGLHTATYDTNVIL